jgi:hypothetical protein
MAHSLLKFSNFWFYGNHTRRRGINFCQVPSWKKEQRAANSEQRTAIPTPTACINQGNKTIIYLLHKPSYCSQLIVITHSSKEQWALPKITLEVPSITTIGAASRACTWEPLTTTAAAAAAAVTNNRTAQEDIHRLYPILIELSAVASQTPRRQLHASVHNVHC